MLQHLELLQTDGSLTSSSTAPLCLPHLTSLGLRAYHFNKLALQTPQLRKLALLCGAHEHSPAVHPQPGKLRMLITLDTLYISVPSPLQLFLPIVLQQMTQIRSACKRHDCALMIPALQHNVPLTLHAWPACEATAAPISHAMTC